MRALTIRLAPRDAVRLNRLAAVMDVPAVDLAEEAIRAFVQEGLRQPRRTKAEPPPGRTARFTERDDGFDVLWTGSMKVTPAEALRKATDARCES